MNYYNEWDKSAADWLRQLIKAGLIPPGDVDERSITEVKAHELTDYTQCHFFAGIGGWPFAFAIAGISEGSIADTGSCPCQPFSGTGKKMGFADPRHLWPAFRRIINRRGARAVYGEQVASGLGREWLARVFSDLEIMGYACEGADLCSAGVGSPNIRQRLYWAGERGGVENSPFIRHERSRETRQRGGRPSDASSACRVGYADHARREGRLIRWNGGYECTTGSPMLGMWSDAELIRCRDEKWRRIEPGSFPLAYGVPSRVGPLLTELRKLGRGSVALARANRNIRLKGYGNAINPWVAAVFLEAVNNGRRIQAAHTPEDYCP